MGCSPSGSLVHGILQARVLEWVAISSPGDLPDPGMEPGSPALQADSSCWATREEEGAGVSLVCFGVHILVVTFLSGVGVCVIGHDVH